ncbi:uncharacterized protein LOC118744839 [Rhagoletis pomonella]|uniref:uncharacterized protein LOC118744839 n=1 Tax=Rhagoletis pomonella TaxID=28610 RepID=UPI00177E83C2|nr:uncharacterized protein LOC118744839 [Rhagoletis pomonella]
MSKPPAKTTQQRTGLKTTTGTTLKKTTVNNPPKTTSGATKVNSQLKTTPDTAAASRVLEEKYKLKSSSQSRRVDPSPIAKTRTPRDVKLKTTPPSKILSTSRAAPKIADRQNAPEPKKRITATSIKSSVNEKPTRVKHSPGIEANVKKKQSKAIKANAVLDTYHNVTVASPPPRRKEFAPESFNDSVVPVENDEQPKRVRTHSLKDEEIIVLRTDSAKQRIEQQILSDVTTRETRAARKLPAVEREVQRTVVKEPVAFDVAFGEPLKSIKSVPKPEEASGTQVSVNGNEAKDGDPDNYSDDFESYESDFDTETSTQNGSIGNSENDSSASGAGSEDEGNSISPISSSSGDERAKNREEMHAINSDDEEESEITQYPITVIHRDKDTERKLDSGNYEMNSRKHPKLSEINTQMGERPFDSMDTSYSVASTDQLDSGISGYTLTNKVQAEVDQFGGIRSTYGGYTGFNTRPIVSKRGVELMNKIQFDILTFSLFELKPISYDIYMQTYGTLNTTQCSTQTNDNRMSSECQTDGYEMRTMWTQHPPQFDLQTVQKLSSGLNGTSAIQNCCGESPTDEYKAICCSKSDVYDYSLQQLAIIRQSKANRIVSEQLKSMYKPVDFERLNSFLLRATSLISRVLSSAQSDTSQVGQIRKLEQYQSNLQAISKGYIPLDTKLLNALRVVRVFASARHDLIITVHVSLPDADVYQSDFSHLLMVWSTNECSQPLRLLSTWSEVCRAEICNDCSDIVICGLHDGSIAMWDLRETYSFCSKLDGYLTHFAATQSVVPTWDTNTSQQQKLVDLGAVIDLRSFLTPPKATTTIGPYRQIQFAALNDSGILSIWTLVETSARPFEFDIPKTVNSHHHQQYSSASKSSFQFEYSSPWARVKLIQSAICDLRDYLESGSRRAQTQFEKTKLLFQKELYSDEALRELNSTQNMLRQSQQLQGLRFTGIDTGSERIYVCINRNFVLTCSKSLKTERFRKINISEGGFLFPTSLKVLTNENYLAVGLSNGSVMIVNCNQQTFSSQRFRDGGGLETAYSREENCGINTPQTPDIDPDTGKSCAIQNIILNERRQLAHEGNSHTTPYETRPSTAACIALINNQKRPFELRVYDQQIIMIGSALRKDLVQSLELSRDGWRLFALINGQIRTYDFYLDREIGEEFADANTQRVTDIAVAKNSQNDSHLIILDEENEVKVHLLKQ